MIHLCALGSGSSGNALVLSADGESILVDGGFSRKELLRRMELTGIDPEKISAALLTHEHDDHVKGCRVFCDQLDIPLCTTALTARFLRPKNKLPRKVYEFEPGEPFEIGNFRIQPFAVQHDAVNPVGFVIRHSNVKIGIATDLGDLNTLAIQHLSNCDALVLESNYDARMLRDSERALALKRRILGRHGHLDNVVAVNALEQLLGENTRCLLLAHLSRECNDRCLVENLFSEKLRTLNREDITMQVIDQCTPSGPFALEDFYG